jgi:hypothetical protein
MEDREEVVSSVASKSALILVSSHSLRVPWSRCGRGEIAREAVVMWTHGLWWACRQFACSEVALGCASAPLSVPAWRVGRHVRHWAHWLRPDELWTTCARVAERVVGPGVLWSRWWSRQGTAQ